MPASENLLTIRCTVLKSWIAFSQENSTPMVRIKLRDISGQETYYVNLYLTEKALPNTVRSLGEAFAWRGESFSELSVNPNIFAGQCCQVKGIRQDNGYFLVKYLNRDTASRDANHEKQVAALCEGIDKFLPQLRERGHK